MNDLYAELSEIMGTLEAYEMELGMMISDSENKKQTITQNKHLKKSDKRYLIFRMLYLKFQQVIQEVKEWI